MNPVNSGVFSCLDRILGRVMIPRRLPRARVVRHALQIEQHSTHVQRTLTGQASTAIGGLCTDQALTRAK